MVELGSGRTEIINNSYDAYCVETKQEIPYNQH